ncbi:MAG: hypothetical protein KF724_00950 [Phycisphaeraceae bacterium]|nr:hypothetical protein [Phycisphaeraceae bacterium]
MIRRSWPEWFEWELELTPHLLRRMRDGSFTELDLRRMLADATNSRRDDVPGRFAVETHHARAAGEIIIEPDPEDGNLIDITAYRAD